MFFAVTAVTKVDVRFSCVTGNTCRNFAVTYKFFFIMIRARGCNDLVCGQLGENSRNVVGFNKPQP